MGCSPLGPMWPKYYLVQAHGAVYPLLCFLCPAFNYLLYVLPARQPHGRPPGAGRRAASRASSVYGPRRTCPAGHASISAAKTITRTVGTTTASGSISVALIWTRSSGASTYYATRGRCGAACRASLRRSRPRNRRAQLQSSEQKECTIFTHVQSDTLHSARARPHFHVVACA